METFAATAAGHPPGRTLDEQVKNYIEAWSRFESTMPEARRLAALAEDALHMATASQWAPAEDIARQYAEGRARQTENRYHHKHRESIRAAGYDPW